MMIEIHSKFGINKNGRAVYSVEGESFISEVEALMKKYDLVSLTPISPEMFIGFHEGKFVVTGVHFYY